MTDRKAEKVVLITGAARRIGRALACDLAADGWTVAVHYRSGRIEADTVVRDIEAGGGRAAAFDADLAAAESCTGLVAAVVDRFGRLDCLINNASLFEKDSFRTMTAETWEAHHAVNLRAPVFLAQAFAARLRDDLEGNIVNIIDQRVWKLTPRFFSYTLAKAGLWTATRTMAQALAPRIRVNAIGPGPALPSSRQSDADFARQEASLPLRRGTTPQEICAAVRFLLATPSITGQMIALDGGQHLAWQTPDVTGLPE